MQRQQISGLQVAAVIISTTIGIGVLALPRFAVLSADTGAPLVTAAGALIMLVDLLMVTALGLRFPDRTIIQYAGDIVGKSFSFVVSLLIVLFLMAIVALISREFGEVVITSLLPDTPIEVTVIMMMLIAAIGARVDIVTFVNIHLFYLPFIMAPGVFIVVLSFKNTRWLNLLPLLGNEPEHPLMGVMTVAALLQGSFIMTMLIPYLRSRKSAYPAMLWGWAVPCALYVTIVIASVGVFGAEELKLIMWPTLELAKTTSLRVTALERLDAAFLAVWVTNVFTVMLSGFFTIIVTTAQMFRLRDYRIFSYFVLPFIFIIAMLPQNVFQMYGLIQIIIRLALVITIGYPMLLLTLAVIRRKKASEL